MRVIASVYVLLCVLCAVCCVCVRNDVFIPFTQITFVWNMAHKIHLYTHSFNFFSHCLFFLFLLTRSFRSLFSGWLFYPSCNFVCTITFNSFLFFSPFFFISFSRAIQISFCYFSCYLSFSFRSSSIFSVYCLHSPLASHSLEPHSIFILIFTFRFETTKCSLISHSWRIT